LIEALALKFKSRSFKEAEVIVNTVFDSMMDALATGERIEIRGFGTFHKKHRAPREGRNPSTGEKIVFEGKNHGKQL